MEWTPIVDCAYDCDISVGTITATGVVTMQFKDFAGNNLTEICGFSFYVTTDAAGLTIEQFGAEATIATYGICNVVTALTAYMCTTDAAGKCAVTLDGSTTVNNYIHIVLPNGKIKHSTIIAFTS
jgi:hypothetical protein